MICSCTRKRPFIIISLSYFVRSSLILAPFSFIFVDFLYTMIVKLLPKEKKSSKILTQIPHREKTQVFEKKERGGGKHRVADEDSPMLKLVRKNL